MAESSGTTMTTSQSYCAYGRKRTTSGGNTNCSSSNSLVTDHTFTGQKYDNSGLQFFNARYYDPQIGTFISPDTIVPEPSLVIDYNRYAYSRGNPLRLVDPSGHAPCLASGGVSFCDNGGIRGGPSWWTSNEVRRVEVENYGIFDKEHIKRGYRSAAFFMAETKATIVQGGGEHSRPGRSGDSYAVLYAVSGDIESDQLDSIVLGIYTDFEVGYEAHQAQNPFNWSAYSPEDLPSDFLGAWAYLNGVKQYQIPDLVERMGEVTPGGNSSIVFSIVGTPDGGFGVSGLPRNYAFLPMAPSFEDYGYGMSQITWQNVAWPDWMTYSIAENGPNTWQRAE